MGIIGRLRSRYNALRALARPAGEADLDRMDLTAEIPLSTGKPLLRVQLQLHSEPQGDGERLRLRAHIQTNLASALRPALQQAAPPLSDAHALTLAGRAGAVVQSAATRALELPLVRALAEPLLQRDFNTWVEMQASTASLDAGARDLIPQGEKLAALGIVPVRKDDGPVAQSWAGQAAGGMAQVSLIQMEKRHLPEQLQRALGDKPFQFAAAIVNTMEEKTSP